MRDYFVFNIGYHSASLTFYFLMSFISMFSLIVLLVSKIIMLNIGEVYYIISKFFPQATENFVQTVFIISKQSGSINIFLVGLAIYFSKDFFIALNNAFSYITQTKQKRNFNLYIMVLSMPVVVLLVILLYILKFTVELVLTYFISAVGYLETLFGYQITAKLYSILIYLKQLLAFGFLFEFAVLFIFIFSAYYLMIKSSKTINRYKLYVAAVVSTIILLWKMVFGIISGMVLSKNPLFLVMGSVFIVIVWVKLMFDTVLIGARAIFYLEKASTREAINTVSKV